MLLALIPAEKNLKSLKFLCTVTGKLTQVWSSRPTNTLKHFGLNM